MAINTLAPFIINGRLRNLMEKSPPLPIHQSLLKPNQEQEEEIEDKNKSSNFQKKKEEKGGGKIECKIPKFIVNVSAMEGKFYRFKTANHPHTNMAKVGNTYI